MPLCRILARYAELHRTTDISIIWGINALILILLPTVIWKNFQTFVSVVSFAIPSDIRLLLFLAIF